MQLGAFSVSLAVKDLNASKAFYEKLGFSALGGDPEHGYLILKNGDTMVGLFQGMLDENILTFNPGWDDNGRKVDPFDDVRAIQAKLESEGVEIETPCDPEGAGPAHIVVRDPDGNLIMFDQHR